jgi:2-keto-4-pentenoate hydratase
MQPRTHPNDDHLVTDMTERSSDIADLLHRARSQRKLLDADREATLLSLDGAYAVQATLTGLRLAEGRCHVGYKLGYTSAAMRQQMGVSAPNFGPLLDDMVLQDGGQARGLMHPRVEPEIGIVLACDLSGAGLMLHEVADAVGEVRASLEIVDSVWRDYRFTLEQNTADGSSAAGVVMGPRLDVDPLQCHRIGVQLLQDDATLTTVTSAAAGGHPLQCVAWLAAQLAERGEQLHKGELIITGGLTAATPLLPGSTISARFGEGATVAVRRPANERDVDTLSGRTSDALT